MNTPADPADYRPLCFVLMPFGIKPDGLGGTVNFDAVYQQLIKPAIEAAGLEPLRADEETVGGFIHKPMFERLLLCDYAVADLTAANANVFYELGVRHAVRPGTTVLLFAQGGRLPFDLAPIRTLPYQLDASGSPQHAATDVPSLTRLLHEAEQTAGELAQGHIDSPLYQLITNYPQVDFSRLDISQNQGFRKQVAYAAGVRQQLAAARSRKSLDELHAVAASLGDLDLQETGILLDLLQSYQGLEAWPDTIALVGQLPRPLAETALVQEQYGMALNRAKRRTEAEAVLTQLIQRRGPGSETYGLLGRVYKDQWVEARDKGSRFLASGLLKKAIDAYASGFEADWRDPYPGVNAVTLMTLADQPDPRLPQLLPVVRYAAERKLRAGSPDYWDYATLLELAVLANDQAGALDYLGQALANVDTFDDAITKAYAPKSTANNLALIRQARQNRGEDAAWLAELEQELTRAAGTQGEA